MSEIPPRDESLIEQIAKADFEAALRKGFWRSVLSWFSQSSNRLLPFDEVRARLPMRGQHYIGLREVPIEKIIGSVGRYQDFDRAFLPRHSRTASRWISIDAAHLQEIDLPPVELYKIGEAYFVKDGNHRVSVARERGQKFIDAYVIEIDTPVPIDEHTDIDELITLHEKGEFYAKTQLDQLRPGAKIDLTLPGQYAKLLEHIDVHRYFMGLERGQEVPYEEAVTSWYDEVYLPLARVIGEADLLKEFPGRTVGDLYLWIIEHLWYLREQYRREVTPEEAANHFREQFGGAKSATPLGVLRRLFQGLAAHSDSSPSSKGDPAD